MAQQRFAMRSRVTALQREGERVEREGVQGERK